MRHCLELSNERDNGALLCAVADEVGHWAAWSVAVSVSKK